MYVSIYIFQDIFLDYKKIDVYLLSNIYLNFDL